MRRCIVLLLLVLSILAAPKSPLAGTWNMFSASYFQMLSEYYSILKDTHYISNSSSITDHTDATKLGSYAWVRAQIGSENRKVYFPARSTPYIFPDDYTTSTYTEISLLPGAIVSIPTGKTLTISKFDAASAGDRRCFSGAGSVAFADGAVSWINSAWFPGGDTDAGVIFARGNIPIWIKADGSVEANGISPTIPPSGPDATGTAGQTAWDQNYIYKCVAPNTWKRIPLSTW